MSTRIVGAEHHVIPGAAHACYLEAILKGLRQLDFPEQDRLPHLEPGFRLTGRNDG